MRTYVITANKHGSTAEIGAAITTRLRERGHDAIAVDAIDVGRLDADSAIVLGSPIYMGKWLPPARKLLDQLADEPRGRPVFVFTVGPVGDPPRPVDARPEPAVEQFAGGRALSSRIFSGRLDSTRLGRLERLAVHAVKAPDGDYRDWDEINAWADEIAERLAAVSPSPAMV
jgi:menaquinone-dependent protoporphyrinogen oxidase